jgi:hypothetical protein
VKHWTKLTSREAFSYAYNKVYGVELVFIMMDRV